MIKGVEKNTVRVNITVSKPIHEYYMRKAKDMGVPMSALMAIALAENAEQKAMIQHLPKLMEVAQNQGLL